MTATLLSLRDFLWSGTAVICWVVALFFLRFWKDTADRLFLFFALAFAVFGTNWAALQIMNPPGESRHYYYVIRLAAFLLLLVGIVDKNRSENS
jgi:hypothetical protein